MIHKIDKSILRKCKKFTTDNERENLIVFVLNLDNFCDYIKSCCSDYSVIERLEFIKAAVVSINSKDLNRISQCSNVTYITSIAKVTCQINKSKQIMNIDAFSNAGFYGENINVAIIDTGISMQPDFIIPTNRIIKFIDFVNFKNEIYDDNGHGTFVAGILLGNGLVSNRKYIGVAPKCNLISLKALNETGEATAIQILKAMEWIYDNHKKYEIKVVCMSFGSDPLNHNDPLVIGAEKLWESGITVVAAAGNSGPEFSTIKSPGTSNKIITVGGIDASNLDQIKPADFSSRGPVGIYKKPDILAPAVNIVSNNNKIISGKAYTVMSGTSVATPMIAGVCALLYEKYPKISPEQVKNYICKCGISLVNNRNIEGFGMLKAH